MGVGVVDGVGDETVLTNRFVERLFPEAKVMWPDVKARDWLLNSNITERRARTQVCIVVLLLLFFVLLLINFLHPSSTCSGAQYVKLYPRP